MPPEQADVAIQLIAETRAENREEHREIHQLVAEVRASQVALEVRLAQIAPRKPRWWWSAALGLALASAGGALTWGATSVVDHAARLAVLEARASAGP